MENNFKVPLTKILAVNNHPNADRLDICTVYGFQVITQKGKFNVGDGVIYIPIDSILSPELENKLFPKDSKIKLFHNRVRQIRIRQLVSQGMLVSFSDAKEFLPAISKLTYENDYSKELGVTKYEPPSSKQGTPGEKKLRDKPLENFHLRKYNGVTNIKWVPFAFKDEEVIIQEKIHGSHIRFGIAPFIANTFWKKVLKLFRCTPKYERVYGSNNVEITNRTNKYKGFYGEDIYGTVLSNNKAFEKLKENEFVHGEIYGKNIQANYNYGSLDEHKLIIFDVRVLQEDGKQKWLNPEECEAFAKERGFDFVPVLYRGIFSKDILNNLTSGPSVLYPKHKVREGVVVKSRFNYDVEQNKQCYKSINPEYLDDTSNTDNH